MSLERRLRRLEGEADAASPTESAAEREKRLAMIHEGAEQQNETYFRTLARERRGELLERVGYGALSVDELRDENFIDPGDTPPFVIAEDGTVNCNRDGPLRRTRKRWPRCGFGRRWKPPAWGWSMTRTPKPSTTGPGSSP